MTPEKQGGYLVKEQKATLYEFNVALALDKLGLEYDFQYSFFGGRSLRGGMVVDFLVYTSPLPTPCWVHGEYWHRGRQATIDKFNAAVLTQVQRGRLAEPVILWGHEIETKEAAMSAVRKAFRL